MADDTQTTSVPAQEPAQSPAGAQNTEPGPVPYDRFQQVNSQLAELKKWRQQAEADQAKRAKDAEAAEAAKMTEQQQYKELHEKATAKLTAAEQRAQTLEAELRTVRIERAFRAQAQTLGLKFATERAAETAFKLIPLDALEVDDSGAVTGLDKALKALKESDGYLFDQVAAPAVTPMDARAGTVKQPKADTQTESEREKAVRARYGL